MKRYQWIVGLVSLLVSMSCYAMESGTQADTGISRKKSLLDVVSPRHKGSSRSRSKSPRKERKHKRHHSRAEAKDSEVASFAQQVQNDPAVVALQQQMDNLCIDVSVLQANYNSHKKSAIIDIHNILDRIDTLSAQMVGLNERVNKHQKIMQTLCDWHAHQAEEMALIKQAYFTRLAGTIALSSSNDSDPGFVPEEGCIQIGEGYTPLMPYDTDECGSYAESSCSWHGEIQVISEEEEADCATV